MSSFVGEPADERRSLRSSSSACTRWCAAQYPNASKLKLGRTYTGRPSVVLRAESRYLSCEEISNLPGSGLCEKASPDDC